MTSKEALAKLNVECIHSNGVDDEYSDELNIIKKDLEVLEILKDNLFEEKGTGRFKGINVISCSLGNEHSGSDYYKVKEWLDE